MLNEIGCFVLLVLRGYYREIRKFVVEVRLKRLCLRLGYRIYNENNGVA